MIRKLTLALFLLAATLAALGAEDAVMVGDHFNDMPMLARDYAHWLVAPANAIELVKSSVRGQNGFVSKFAHGHGVADGLEFCLKRAAVLNFVDKVGGRSALSWDEM